MSRIMWWRDLLCKRVGVGQDLLIISEDWGVCKEVFLDDLLGEAIYNGY